jgi:hypothetical protein
MARASTSETMRLKLLFAFVLLIGGVNTSFSQEYCPVGDIKFACPDDFSELKVDDNSTRLYKYKREDTLLYFFMTAPAADFEPAKIAALLASAEGQYKPGDFEWKPVMDPLVMSMKTKAKFEFSATYGLSSEHLIEIKAFKFGHEGKDFVLGYISDWTENPRYNRSRFVAGSSSGDHAVGCNTVVTVLNSVLKEFPEKGQGCYLSAFSTAPLEND